MTTLKTLNPTLAVFPLADIYPGSSLVELLHYCLLIGQELHIDAMPALLCHKEPACRIQSPLLGALERKNP